MVTKILSIDTSNSDEIMVVLMVGSEKFEKNSNSKTEKAQALLPLIRQLLEEHDLTPKDITEIKLASGPGSYTGLRVGASIAQAFGWVLDIPVNGKKEPVELTYE